MKKGDLIFILAFVAIFVPFLVSDRLFDFFVRFSTEWAFTASFIKFALLATMGEMLGSRIRTGIYLPSGFGLIPRALVWGFLGMTVKAAFMIFASGVPSIIQHLGMNNTSAVMAGQVTAPKILLAFCISFFLNIFYAPILMITHRISDLHIASAHGERSRLFRMPDVAQILASVDWKSMWGFVLKKTIPFFWIPAQTVTFLLPPEFQILFAALLSTVLGVILALSGQTADTSGKLRIKS
jgi:hypothetical protein